MPETVVKQIKIMVSSTRADLMQYREEASSVIRKIAEEKEKGIQLVEVSMEKETQTGDEEFAIGVSKRWVEESDWVIVIVGWNYGSISTQQNAEGLSVTEWEYRHAVANDKKIFIFMAGEPNTVNQYRVSDEEREDLKDWIPQQSVEQTEKLQAFKQELSHRNIGKFRNLQMFRERLEKTLRNAIDDNITTDIPPGSPLAELIVAVLPKIRDCIRKVELVANCKKIHDSLHELRQHAIRPLREEVLSLWQQEGELNITRERVLWRCLAHQAKNLGGINMLRDKIGPDHQGLRTSVDTLLDRSDNWNMELNDIVAQKDRAQFTEFVDHLADNVQQAFSEADRSMAREEGELRERYVGLLEDLKSARQQKRLEAGDQERLDKELEIVDANRSLLKKALTTHHDWQSAHDKLVELDSFRELESFERKLNYYRDAPLVTLLGLVDTEIKEFDEIQTSSAALAADAIAAVSQQSPEQVNSVQSVESAFLRDLQELKSSLETLRQRNDVMVFDEMRGPFDDAFYFVDKRTFLEVERANQRAYTLQRWLDELAASQRETA